MFYKTEAIRIRLTFVILTFAAIAVGMLGRTTWIQIIGDPKLESLAKKQFQSKFLIKPRRGLITDRAGEPLAINLETSSLAGNPSKIIHSHATLLLLSRALGVSVPQLKKSLKSKKSFAWIERHIKDDRLEKFKRAGIVTTTGDMPEGLWLVKEMKRVYPHGELAAPLLGTVNVDAEGIEGVELWKDATLRGKSASFDAIKDALGRPVLLNNSNASRTTDGINTELSIDASLQFSVEEALQDTMIKTRAQAALVMVMDSNTGEMLAIAQKTNTRDHRKLRALTDGYEPGSTIKPLLLAAALGHGMKITDSLFGHYGKLKIQNRVISEAEAHEKFGYISLKKMIEVSSNVVAAELAIKLGGEKYVASLKELGFGQKTGTLFPGEISGWMPAQPRNLRPLTLATMGFGQGMFVTPIQMLRAYAAISNGGFLVEPTLLKRNEKEHTQRIPVLRSQVAHDVTQALLGVTENEMGTGKKARLPGFKVAGKTGTAQTVDPHSHHYSTSRYIASFIGFPVGIKQPITILTLVDHPKGIYYSSETAAPLFSEVLKQTMSRFGVPPTEPIHQPLAQVEATPVPQNTPHTVDVIQTQVSSAEPIEAVSKSLMPHLAGLTPQEAMTLLKSYSPQIKIHGFGIIKKQIPESGSPLHEGERVSLYLEE